MDTPFDQTSYTAKLIQDQQSLQARSRPKMSLTPEGERVLRAMFSIGNDRSLAIGNRLRVPTPGATELFQLCELFATEPREEELQCFLSAKNAMMRQSFGRGQLPHAPSRNDVCCPDCTT